MDYFEVFSLPRKLVVDVAGLEKRFYGLSRRLHPDRFAGRPVEEQDAALAEASRLNDAYRTLKEPIARTEYLLRLEGVELEEQTQRATDAARVAGVAKKQVVPAEMLEEVFELNMQMQEMRMAKELGDDEDPQLQRDLEAARRSFEGMLEGLQVELEELWAAWDQASEDEAREKAKVGLVGLLNRRSYVRNLVRDVNDVLG